MTLYRGDCVEVLGTLLAASVDAVVTDPPAGIGFMGVAWDSYNDGRKGGERKGDQWDWSGSKERAHTADDHTRVVHKQGRHFRAAMTPIFKECLRVLKPGGHALIWALPRTSHWTAAAIEDSGFEIRDVVTHLFGSGFPKSKNLGDGWGTALKPASEHWILCRKPLSEPTIAANVLAHGVGGINVDGCRVDSSPSKADGWRPTSTGNSYPDQSGIYSNGSGHGLADASGHKPYNGDRHPAGRWPANVCLDDEAAALLDEQSGELTSNSGVPFTRNTDKFRNSYGSFQGRPDEGGFYGDTGGASRFFYQAKASRDERNKGLYGVPKSFVATMGDGIGAREHNPEQPTQWAANDHPTVKPIALMRWLCRLITPPGGTVLDCFMGSGTTGCAAALEGFQFIGIEADAHYFDLAERRIAYWASRPQQQEMFA